MHLWAVTLRSSRRCEHERALGFVRTRINQVDYQPIIRSLLVPVLATSDPNQPGRQMWGGEGNDGRLARPFIHDDGSGRKVFPPRNCQRYQSKRFLDLTRKKAKRTKTMCSDDSWTLNKHKNRTDFNTVPFWWFLIRHHIEKQDLHDTYDISWMKFVQILSFK